MTTTNKLILGDAYEKLQKMSDNSVDISITSPPYNLKHLVLFTKCTNLCNSIEMYMKNNFPIIIKFAVGSLGSLKLALAPQCPLN